MKKITLIFAAVILSLSLAAQQFDIRDIHTVPAPFQNNGGKGIDTLMAPAFHTGLPCLDSAIYINIGTGYLTGTGTVSGYTMTECAQTFDNTTTGNVTGALIPVNVFTSSGAGTFTAKVYDVDGSNKPTTVIGTSNPVNVSDLTIGLNIIPVVFSSNPSVTGKFAISLVYPTGTGDTLCVLQTRPGCVDTTKDGYAHLNVAGTWMAYKTVMAMQVPPMESFDLFITSIVSSTADIAKNPANALVSMYPNPADHDVTIASLSAIQEVRILNSLGQCVVHAKTNDLMFQVNTSDLNTGIYFVQIETERGSVTRKLIVNR